MKLESDNDLLINIDRILVEQKLVVKETTWSDKTKSILLAAYRLGRYDESKNVDESTPDASAVSQPEIKEEGSTTVKKVIANELSFLS